MEKLKMEILEERRKQKEHKFDRGDEVKTEEIKDKTCLSQNLQRGFRKQHLSYVSVWIIPKLLPFIIYKELCSMTVFFK